MIQAYKKYWKGYVDFSGTTSRKDYWLAVLASIIVTIILEVVGILLAQGQTNTGSNTSVLSTLIMVYSLVTLLPSLAIMVRRLRDAGQSWANIFWPLLPLAGIIILIVKLCKPSAERTEYSTIPTQFTTGTPVYRTYQQTSCSASEKPQTGSTATAKTSFCNKCGASLADNAKFCAKCGAKRFEPAEPARTSEDNISSENTEDSALKMRGWIFSCYDHDRVQALSMFSNTYDFYSKANIVKMVRDWMHLPESEVDLEYIAAPDWNAPDVKATDTSFDCNIDALYAKVVDYLWSNDICSRGQAISALKNNMPYPKPGLLLIVFLVAD